jgi:CHAT domain-containing protein
MAQAVFIHEGCSIDYTPAADVAAGDVVVQGDLVGVTKQPIPANQLGALVVEGVFDFAKPAAWVELGELLRALPRGAVFIDFARVDWFAWPRGAADSPRGQPARYAAWIAHADGSVRVVDLGPAEDVDNACAAVRRLLARSPQSIAAQGERAAEKTLHQDLTALSKLVLVPLLPHLRDATALYLCPDASLWLAPWAALPLPDGSFAVESYTIRLLVSGRDLVHEPVRLARPPSAPLLLADPDFDLGRQVARREVAALLRGDEELPSRAPAEGLRLGNVRRLPYTALEAKLIAPRLETWLGHAPHICIDRKALETVVKRAQGPRVLVLSTHGYFLPDRERKPVAGERGSPSSWENPLLRCGLLLAGCNDPPKEGEPGDDGVLTGLEIVGADLRGTELVVLSACETGLGDVRNGEGVAGLRQAFQLAGAEAVVATLWQIPDRQSAQLMIRFFDELAEKKDKATALSEAQRAMIQQRREKYGAAHPFFWAAFTLTGR